MAKNRVMTNKEIAAQVALDRLASESTSRLKNAVAALMEIETGRNVLLGLHEISRDVTKLDLGYMPKFQDLVKVMAGGVINGTVRHTLEIAAIQIKAEREERDGEEPCAR